MTLGEAWRLLGLSPSGDVGAIRARYAELLRAADIDADPERFATLRAARDTALRAARTMRHDDAPGVPRAEVATPDLAAPFERTLPAAGARAWNVHHAPGARSGSVLSVPPPTAETPPLLMTPACVGPSSSGAAAVSDPRLRLDPPILARPARDAFAPASIEEHLQAALAILQAGRADPNMPPGRQEARALQVHVAALLADPRMEGLDFHGNAERWFADMLVQAGARGAPVLEAVIAHFGWDRQRGALQQFPAAAELVTRLDVERATIAYADPGHRLHRAWLELIKPATDRSRRSLFVRRARVKELLATVRRDHPRVEDQFDGWRVALWERPINAVKMWSPVGLVVWGMLRIGTAIWFPSHDEQARRPIMTPPSPVAYAPPALTTADEDLSSVLAWTGGPDMTLAHVRAANPALATALEERWTAAHAAGRSRAEFIQDLDRELDRRLRVARGRAGYDLLRDHLQLRLDEAAATGREGAPFCAAFWEQGDLSRDVAEAMRDRVQAGNARLLLADHGRMPAGTPSDRVRYSIPGAVVRDGVIASGMSRKDFVDALGGEGGAAGRCLARTSLARAVLALPHAEALPLLRVM